METTAEKIITFKAEDELFLVDRNILPENSLLKGLADATWGEQSTKETREIDIAANDLRNVLDFLQGAYIKYLDPACREVLDYLNVHPENLPEEKYWQFIKSTENYMRNNMYDPAFYRDAMNQEKYYQLLQLNQGLWEKSFPQVPLRTDSENKDKEFLFNFLPLNPQPWPQIMEKLTVFDRIFNIAENSTRSADPHIFIAGGAIFSILYGTPINDIDIFLHDYTKAEDAQDLQKISAAKKEALHKIINIIIALKPEKVYRTKNAVTLQFRNIKHFLTGDNLYIDNNEDRANDVKHFNVQIILRLYRTPSEVLHGFDVDSCCLGYDGRQLFATHRAAFALQHGYNTVDLALLSPSYEYRLAKYGTRGVAVKIPNFAYNNVEWEAVKEHDNFPKAKARNVTSRYGRVKELSNIDILIYLHYCYKISKRRQRTAISVERMALETCDYTPLPMVYYNGEGSRMDNLIFHLLRLYNNHSLDRAHFHKHFEEISLHSLHIQKHWEEIKNREKPKPKKPKKKMQDAEFAQSATLLKDILVSELPKKEEEITHILRRERWDHFLRDVYTSSFSRDSNTEDINGLPEEKLEFLAVSSSSRFGHDLLMYLKFLFNIPDCIFALFSWNIPQCVDFITTNPGSQMTGTFRPSVLHDPNIWYMNNFYPYAGIQHDNQLGKNDVWETLRRVQTENDKDYTLFNNDDVVPIYANKETEKDKVAKEKPERKYYEEPEEEPEEPEEQDDEPEEQETPTVASQIMTVLAQNPQGIEGVISADDVAAALAGIFSPPTTRHAEELTEEELDEILDEEEWETVPDD